MDSITINRNNPTISEIKTDVLTIETLKKHNEEKNLKNQDISSGKIYTKNGVFEGNWNGDGLISGKGVITTPYATITGEWNGKSSLDSTLNLVNGVGEIKYYDGTKFEGIWSSYQYLPVKGKYYSIDNCIWEGTYDESGSFLDGKGSIKTKDHEFIGVWKDSYGTGAIISKGQEKLENAKWYLESTDLLSGNGVIIINDNKYDGKWEEQLGGEGTIYYSDGTIYKGQWDGHGWEKYNKKSN